MNNQRERVVTPALILFALALIARIVMLIIHPFDGLYGQDAFAYYDYSIALRQALLQGQSIPPFFWPIGYPLHLILAFSLLDVQPGAAQLISLIAGAAIAPLTYLVARESLLDLDPARAQRAGLVAGSIMIVAGQLMISSISIMSDVTALAWATLSAWLLLRYIRHAPRRSGQLVLTVCGLSIAILNRWAYALLILPWTIAIVLTWRKHWSSIGLRRAVVLSLMGLLVGGSIVGGQLLIGGSHAGDLQVVGWNPINAGRSTVTNSDGTFNFSLPIGLFYAEPLIHPAFIFPLLIPLWLVGLRLIAQRDRAAAVLLIGWPLIVYSFLMGIAWQNLRFSLELFPPIAIWVGLGFDRIWQTRSSWRRGLIGLIVISWIGSALWSIRTVGNFAAEKNIDLDRVGQLAGLLPADALVVTFNVTGIMQHYTTFDTIELFNETPTTLADRVCGQTMAYAYLDLANVDRQWQGLPPEINYQWLAAHAGLTSVDQFDGYSLFKIEGHCQ